MDENELERAAAEAIEIPDHLRMNWRPIEEYDCKSPVMLKSGSVKAFGQRDEETDEWVQLVGCYTIPIEWEPQEFSEVHPDMALALIG